ncbi:hypothetical protein KC330_g122 [Hortaea werneckii]|nr:hypothetical protein KC330_g122 [Hortaea werneckii]
MVVLIDCDRRIVRHLRCGLRCLKLPFSLTESESSLRVLRLRRQKAMSTPMRLADGLWFVATAVVGDVVDVFTEEAESNPYVVRIMVEPSTFALSRPASRFPRASKRTGLEMDCRICPSFSAKPQQFNDCQYAAYNSGIMNSKMLAPMCQSGWRIGVSCFRLPPHLMERLEWRDMLHALPSAALLACLGQ